MKVKTEKTISVAHHLPNYEGKCKNLHGHNIRVVVEVEASVNPETGMVIDFNQIKNTINKYDHQDLNQFIEVPTAENFVRRLLDDLDKVIGDNNYYSIKVRVYENKDSYAEDAIYNVFERVRDNEYIFHRELLTVNKG